MAPKEPNRHQLSSRLSYQQHTPKFLQKLQNKYSGHGDVDDEESEPEFEPDDGSGRPPIPRRPRERPAIPVRPDDDPGSADEDSGDERPVVVVLKEGKHLSAREAENVKRKEKGLSPLPEPTEVAESEPQKQSSSKDSKPATKPKETPTLSFSSKKSGSKLNDLKESLKRKGAGPSSESDSTSKPKRRKKEKKGLLSFDDS
ncbi:hypothetical protein ONZ45_g1392 [Pleurotus djamor]|nr:hypothetical protein ONZ45_g1392 [Pleurotus djamor]